MWAMEPIEERPGCFRLLNKRTRYHAEHWRQVGVLCFDHPRVRGEARQMAQDFVILLNTPGLIDEWLALKQEAAARGSLREVQ